MNDDLLQAPLEQRTLSYWRACQNLIAAGGDGDRRRPALRVLATLCHFESDLRLRLAASRTVIMRQLKSDRRLLDQDERTGAARPVDPETSERLS